MGPLLFGYSAVYMGRFGAGRRETPLGGLAVQSGGHDSAECSAGTSQVSKIEISGPGEHRSLAGAEIWGSEDFLKFAKA